MIAVYLDEIGFDVKHIMKDKTIKTHKSLEDQLLKKYSKKLPVPSLFEPDVNEKSQLKAAYRLHNKEIGWISKNSQNLKTTYYD